MGSRDQGVDARVRGVPQADVGDGGHGDARLEVAADRVVLGGVSGISCTGHDDES